MAIASLGFGYGGEPLPPPSDSSHLEWVCHSQPCPSLYFGNTHLTRFHRFTAAEGFCLGMNLTLSLTPDLRVCEEALGGHWDSGLGTLGRNDCFVPVKAKSKPPEYVEVEPSGGMVYTRSREWEKSS